MASKLAKIFLLGLLIGFTANSALAFTPIQAFSANIEVDPFESPVASPSEEVGAWIIIAGDRSDHDKLGHIIYGCDRVYEILTGCGYGEDDIEYLIPQVDGFSSPYSDGYTNLGNIDTAITSWAMSKVNENLSLGMYLFDHGGVNSMCIPGPDLSPSHLDAQLDALEEETECKRQIIIYEACHSGSFIDELSQDNRIIATATDITHGSSVNPAGNWATFSEGFWNSISKCNTVGEAFEDAEAFVEASGLGGSQIPWLDDNHDGVPHEVDSWGHLPNGGDGSDALSTVICSKVECYFKFFVKIPIWFWLPFERPDTTYIVKLDTTVDAAEIFLRIIPEAWVPPQPDGHDEGSSLMDVDLPGVTVSDDGQHDDGMPVDLAQYLVEAGTYKICVYARDVQTGMISNVVSSYVTINADGEPPEDRELPAIQFVDPAEGKKLSGVAKIQVEAKDNYGVDKINLYLDEELVGEKEMGDYLPYPEIIFELDTSVSDDGNHGLVAEAFDHAGNSKNVSLNVEFSNGSDGDGGFPFPDIPGFTPIFLAGASVLAVLYILSKIKNRK